MRIAVIGGTGHIGTYLIPRLIEAGHDVVSISRGQREPYQANGAWKHVEQLAVDRSAEESQGVFGRRIRNLGADVVVDLICFNLESARQLAEALRDDVRHFIHCGTIWVHGPSIQSPSDETQSRHPFGEYGIQKAVIEDYLMDQARRYGFPATVLHPGHIVGPGWLPLNPAGNFNPEVFASIARGDELALPNFGMETVHHVHADDVAQVFEKSINNWSTSVGESFHAVSPSAISLRGYAESISEWFARPPRLKFLPWNEWAAGVSEQDAAATKDHITHSPNCSIAKAERLLDYKPRYTSLQAVYESVDWLIKNKVINI